MRSMGEGAMARNYPKGPNVPQETRDTGLQPKWDRPGSLDGNFPQVEGWQPQEIFGSGLSWNKQAPSLQGHKALTVQEQSFQGGGNILLSVPRRQVSDQPSPHPCIPALGQSSSPFQKLLLGRGRGSWGLLSQRAGAKRGVLFQGGCRGGSGVGIFSPWFTRHTWKQTQPFSQQAAALDKQTGLQSCPGLEKQISPHCCSVAPTGLSQSCRGRQGVRCKVGGREVPQAFRRPSLRDYVHSQCGAGQNGVSLSL